MLGFFLTLNAVGLVWLVLWCLYQSAEAARRHHVLIRFLARGRIDPEDIEEPTHDYRTD